MGLTVQVSSALATDMKISAGNGQFKCREETSGVKCIKQGTRGQTMTTEFLSTRRTEPLSFRLSISSPTMLACQIYFSKHHT